MFDKSKLNFLIDALMFLCMTAIAGLGFLMKFNLIPGFARWDKYGRSVELTLLGMDRHQWGTIHLTIAFVLLGALVLHIILHWKVIVGIYQRLIPHQPARRIIAVVFIAAAALLLLTPVTVKPRVEELGRGEGRQDHASHEESAALFDPCGGCPEAQRHTATGAASDSLATPVGAGELIDVKGYMTLGEVCGKYGVPTDCLLKHLGLPAGTSSNEHLGRLRKQHDFTMDDVEQTIRTYKNAQ